MLSLASQFKQCNLSPLSTSGFYLFLVNLQRLYISQCANELSINNMQFHVQTLPHVLLHTCPSYKLQRNCVFLQQKCSFQVRTLPYMSTRKFSIKSSSKSTCSHGIGTIKSQTRSLGLFKKNKTACYTLLLFKNLSIVHKACQEGHQNKQTSPYKMQRKVSKTL